MTHTFTPVLPEERTITLRKGQTVTTIVKSFQSSIVAEMVDGKIVARTCEPRYHVKLTKIVGGKTHTFWGENPSRVQALRQCIQSYDAAQGRPALFRRGEEISVEWQSGLAICGKVSSETRRRITLVDYAGEVIGAVHPRLVLEGEVDVDFVG